MFLAPSYKKHGGGFRLSPLSSIALMEERVGERRRKNYSTFCTCSRICSINTFNSTEARVVSTSTDLAPKVFASRCSSCIRKSSRRPTKPPCFKVRRTSVICASKRSISSLTSSFVRTKPIPAPNAPSLIQLAPH